MSFQQFLPDNAAKLAISSHLELAELACAKRQSVWHKEPSPANALALATSFRQAGKLKQCQDMLDWLQDQTTDARADKHAGLRECLSAQRQQKLPSWQLGHGIHPGPFIIIDDFLPSEAADFWLREMQRHEQRCVEAGTLRGLSTTPSSAVAQHSKTATLDPNIRKTKRYTPPRSAERRAFRLKIKSHTAQWAKALHVPAFDVGGIEVSLNQLGHGGFFKVHRDGDGAQLPGTRQLSYMLYLNEEPAAFTGGEFLLFDTDPAAGEIDTKRFTRISPRHNRLVVIRSDYFHAVAPVNLQPDIFAKGRMGLTGHIRNAQAPAQ